MPTLDEWLTVVEPHLAAALVGEAERRRIREVAHYLPADCLGVLEVRLGPGETAVDLSVRLDRPDQARQLVPHLSRPHIREFLTRWAEEESGAPVWLEFDLDPGAAGLPSPVLAALQFQTDPLGLADSLLPALHGRPPTPAQRAAVLLCAREVPGSARIIYVFSLRSRPHEAVRLDILGLGAPERGEYLRRVAPHLRDRVEELAPLLAGTETPHLSFDIGAEGVLSRIGLEGSFLRQPNREPRWAELLDRFVARGLCATEKRDAVLAWSGYDSYWTARDLWPLETQGVSGSCLRALSHVKIVGELGRPPQAKAYLTFCRYRRPPVVPLGERYVEE